MGKEIKALRVCRLCNEVFKVFAGESKNRKYCNDCRKELHIVGSVDSVLEKILGVKEG